MNRRQRMRAVTYACWIMVAASFGWQAASDGWLYAAKSAAWLLALLVVLVALLVWIERGDR